MPDTIRLDMIRDTATLKRYFETNDKPSQQQFWDLIDTLDYVRGLAVAAANVLVSTNNLSDVNSVVQARTNLSLYSKAEVELFLQQRPMKSPVRVATTANITLSGTQTIDGVVLVAGDRVLARSQSTGSQNGFWVVASGSWTRPTDFQNGTNPDGHPIVYAGITVYVNEGTANADSIWALTSPDTAVTVDTSALTFSQLSGKVKSVNGYTGDVVLAAADVGVPAYLSSSHYTKQQVYYGATDSPGALTPYDTAIANVYFGPAGTIYVWAPGAVSWTGVIT